MLLRLLLILSLLSGTVSATLAQDSSSTSGAASQISALKESVAGEEKPAPVLGGLSAREEAGFSESLFRMLKGLGLCLGVLLVGAHFVRRAGGQQGAARAGRRLKILERLPISSKSNLVLVEFEGRTLLVAVGTDNVSFCPSGSAGVEYFSDSLDAIASDKLEAMP